MTGNRRPAKFRGAKKSTPATGSENPAAGSVPATSRQGKYNARGRKVNGVFCASEKEAIRYEQLLRLEMAGAIERLRTQVTFDLTVNNRLITRYRADFCYDVVTQHGDVVRSVTEDIKGFETPEFVIKHKLFDALIVPALTVITPKSKAATWDGVLPPGPGTFEGAPPPGCDVIEEAKASFMGPDYAIAD